MEIQLIHGEFSSNDTLNIIAEMIQIKIKYHENAIYKNSSEEDIKYRESKIKYLQNELHELKNHLNVKSGKVNIHAAISLS